MAVFYEKGKKYNYRSANGISYFRVTATINGKRKTFYGDGEKDARMKMEEAKALASQGIDLSSQTAKVGTVFRYWLYNVKRVDNIKASTFARYEMSFRVHIEPDPISGIVIGKLNSAVLQSYVTSLYEDKHLSGGNIKAIVKVWKMFCSWAQDEGYFLKSPCRNLSVPGQRDNGMKNFEVFTADERKRMLEYMTESHYQYDTLVLLAFATGMRLGELLSLRWDDIYDGMIHVSRSTAIVDHIDKDGNRERYREIWDTKTKNSVRNIPILPEIEEMLRRHHLAQRKYFLCKGIAQSEYVFTTMTGELIDATNFHTSFERMLKRAGVPNRKFHAIRHTFATEAIRHGVDVKDLQLLMGHSDLETTYVYVQSDDDSRKKAILQMGNLVEM